VVSSKVPDLSEFGPHIYQHCQYLETYRLVRDDEPLCKYLLNVLYVYAVENMKTDLLDVAD